MAGYFLSQRYMVPDYVKRSIVGWLVLSTVFTASNYGYAALSSGLSVSDRTASGNVLSAAKWNKVVDSVIELDARTASVGEFQNASWYSFPWPISLTSASQNFWQVLSLPSAGTYFVWINARVDINPSSYAHFFLSTSPAGTPLFWYNYFTNPQTTWSYLATEFSNMGVYVATGPTNIYLGSFNGIGTLNGIGWTQSTVGYFRLK